MPNIIEGNFSTKNKSYAIVAGRFNELITEKLCLGALDCLKRHQVPADDIQVAWVPGAFEIPLVAKKLALSKKFDSIICLGAVIRGSTPHFDHVASEVSKGVGQTSLETQTPLIFGIVIADNVEQALERAGTKAGNKGWQAALSAMEMASLLDFL